MAESPGRRRLLVVDDFADAVRALDRPDIVPAPGGQEDICPASGPRARGSVSPGAGQAPAVEPQAWQLLGQVRRLRAHERRELVGFLHDGPIQELTALILKLQMISRSESADLAVHCDGMLRLLNAAAASLRWLIEGSWPFLTPETQLAPALQQRSAWLLAGPATVDVGPLPTVPEAAEVPVIVDVVELMLLVLLPDGQPVRAHVAVRTAERPIQIELTLTPAAGDDGLTGDPAAAQASLDGLARALGVSAEASLGERQWRARMVLPGRADAPSRPLGGQ